MSKLRHQRKFDSKAKLVTKWLFPIGSEADLQTSRSQNLELEDEPLNREKMPKSQRGMKGVALLAAVLIISMMMIFASEFIISSSVDLSIGTAGRDNVRAEYIAKSGANWARWLNLFDYGLDLQFAQAPDPAMKGAKAAIGPLWDKLNMIFSYDSPLDMTQTKTFLQAFGMSALMDSQAVELLQSLGGELGVDVADEGGKINLNVCYQSATLCKATMAQLSALMNCSDIEKEYMRENNIRPAEVLAKIQDWIDGNSVAEPNSGVSSEDDAYLKRTPSHKAKNAPLDTLEELKVVDGWTDELHAYFSPYLTVYPFVHAQDQNKASFKLNINSLGQEAIRCLFSRELGQKDARDGFAKKFRDLTKDSSVIANNDQELGKIVQDLISYQVDPAEKGKEDSDKSTWLTTSSRVYRIRAKGVVGNQTKTVEYILERQSITQRKASPNSPPWKLNGFYMR
jgi:type II secretory pathway component PulK